MKQTAVDFLIMQIELKADSIHCNTQLNRSVKGAYVDCLVMLKQTKEMEKQQKLDASNVNRVEVIQHSEPINGRAYVNNNAKDVEIQFQDNNKTLKIFLK
jgi:hypothetical protein